MRLFIFLGLVFFWLKANGQETVDSSTWELVIPIEINEARPQVSNIINLSRKDFLSLSASFDDPSRLLVKFPGFSSPNDQNNGIVYHGMPAWMSGWTLYGAEILSPNHLSAAGTFNNSFSPTAGGVNAFSGQAIGKYTYRANPDIHTTNDYFAGVSEIKLRDPYKNQVSLNTSLIGMEGGIDLKGKHWNLMSNARYSTVGLLSLLGADFGGEEINYQDVVAKLGYSKGAVKLNVYGLVGSSTNSKDTITTESPLTTESYISRLQEESVIVSGINLEIDKENSLFESTINYSRNNKSEVLGRFEPLSSTGLRTRDSISNLISTNTSYSIFRDKIDWEFNYRSKVLFEGGSDRFSLNQIGVFNKFYIHSRLFLNTGVSGLGRFGSIENKFSGNYALGLTWIDPSYNYKSSIKFSRNTQLGESNGTFGSEGLTKSYNFQAQLEDQKTQLSYSFFGHAFRQIFATTGRPLQEAFIFNNFENIRNRAGGLVPVPLSNALILGMSVSKKIQFTDRLNANVNYTFLRAKFREYQTGGEFETFNLPFANRFNTNILITCREVFTPGLDLSFSTSIRDGFNTGFTETFEEPFSQKTPFYFRSDLRINYTPKRKNKKYESFISLDIQNITNRKNVVGDFTDELTQEVLPREQLGILPVLSWRIVI
jgi:hypothetical protein